MNGYIYLAGPYSHELAEIRHKRYMALTRKAAELMINGHTVYSPITHNHVMTEHFNMPKDFKWWSKHDYEMLRHASKLVVLRLDGYHDSIGVTAEIQAALAIGIPLEYVDE